MFARAGVVLLGLGMALACAGFDRESGVMLQNQLDQVAWGYIEGADLLEDGENLLAYYDVTLTLNGDELAVLTDRRVLYLKEGRVTAIPLANVVDVQHVDGEPGDRFLIRSDDGQMMQIDIALWNGGEIWDQALTAAWDAAREAPSSPEQTHP